MSLYYCLVPKMANAVVLWVIVYFCVMSVNMKDKMHFNCELRKTFFKVKTRKKIRDFTIGSNYYYNNIVNTC